MANGIRGNAMGKGHIIGIMALNILEDF